MHETTKKKFKTLAEGPLLLNEIAHSWISQAWHRLRPGSYYGLAKIELAEAAQ